VPKLREEISLSFEKPSLRNFKGIENVLSSLGFGSYKSRIYLAALSLGRASVGELARAAGVPLPKVYEIADELAQTGLLARVLIAPKTYAPISPSNVFRKLVEKKQRELMSLKKFVEAIQKINGAEHKEPEFSLFRNRKKIWKFIANYLQNESQARYWACVAFKNVTPIMPIIRKLLRSDKSIDFRIIGPKGGNHKIAKKYHAIGCAVRLTDIVPPIRFSVHDDKMVLLTPRDTEDYTTLCITSRPFVQSFTDLFKYYWSNGEELDKYEKS